MKIEIEWVSNGYIITIPPEDEESTERKTVIEEIETDLRDDFKDRAEAFDKLVYFLQETFGIHNSKHRDIGYIHGLCSEHIRWSIHNKMEKSLKNPKNNTGD